MSETLTPEDRRRLEVLFDRAADLPVAEHAAFVDRECGSNDALRERLSRLLEGLVGEDLLNQLQPGAPSRAGTRIGPYELLERVGQGGMGEVYEAEQLDPVVRRVALKIIKPGMDSAQVVARFEVERQALARMSHPNIAQVHGGGTTDDGRPYFVMELVNGEPLGEYCDRRKLSTRERLEIFLRICDGVQHAHQNGIIHRDLKPSNLLVITQDDRAVPKIIDFGVARATTGDLAERTLQTMVGQIVGTLAYMSPEQADPTGVDIDTRSDIYSLGVVLYQLLSGLLPFEHDSAVDLPLSELRRAIREKDPPTPSSRLRRKTGTATSIAPLHAADERSLIRQLSGDLDWICLKALEKDPSRRYSAVSELAEDLRRHLADVPVLAGRPGVLYRARKFVRRHRVAVTAGALIAASVAAGLSGIVSGRLKAAARGDELLRLSDGYRLRQLLKQADELWPCHPDREKIGDMEAWMGRARALVSNLDDHRRTLSAMRGRAPLAKEVEDPSDWSPRSIEEQWVSGELWQYDAQWQLVAGLEALESGLLAEDEIVENRGWSVPKRIAFARELDEGFAEGGDYARAWEEALPQIREAYPGLELDVQMGLLPLGRDPKSDLWEFAHLMSCELVEREGGRLVPVAETGLVLVLLPGGEFKMGAQADDSSGDNYDPQCERREGPVHTVTLVAFFISKYEMTQSQWERFAGWNPAGGRQAHDKPVHRVTANQCDTIARRLGLVLPSEEQWEYAARGGTRSAWSTGDDVESLRGAANILDELGVARTPPWMTVGDHAAWSDGHAGLAPVGTLDPNPFGLHNIHGNASEWTSSHPGPYGTRKGNPRGTFHLRLARGGNFASGPMAARSAFRSFTNDPDFAHPGVGVRLARAVDP